MNLFTVATELADHIRVVLSRTDVGSPGSVSDPCAVVPLPVSLTFDQMYSRGQDMLLWEVLVIVSKIDDKRGLARMAEYAAGAGPKSIKAAIEGGEPYTACGDVFVSGVEFDTVTWQGTDFQGALFTIEIRGRGLS
jgi:hypothetical protein